MTFFQKLTTKALPFLFILVSPITVGQTFMTEDELMNTIPGSTISGISIKDGKTRWTQIYAEPKKGKTKGKIKGDWAGDPYVSKWYIKKGKWCEKWGTGKGCWDMERVDEKTLKPYEKGKPLKIWEIQ